VPGSYTSAGPGRDGRHSPISMPDDHPWTVRRGRRRESAPIRDCSLSQSAAVSTTLPAATKFGKAEAAQRSPGDHLAPCAAIISGTARNAISASRSLFCVTSIPALARMNDWIDERNVASFAAAVAITCDYDFDPRDVDAISSHDLGSGNPFSYELIGRRASARLTFSHEPGTSVVEVEVELPIELDAEVRLAVRLAQDFLMIAAT
jgi:hypothetical protein